MASGVVTAIVSRTYLLLLISRSIDDGTAETRTRIPESGALLRHILHPKLNRSSIIMAHSSAASAHPHPYGVRYHAPVYSEFEILCLCNAVEQLRPSTAADWAMVASDHAVAFDHDGHP